MTGIHWTSTQGAGDLTVRRCRSCLHLSSQWKVTFPCAMCPGGRVMGVGSRVWEERRNEKTTRKRRKRNLPGNQLALPGKDEYPSEIWNHGFEVKMVTIPSNHHRADTYSGTQWIILPKCHRLESGFVPSKVSSYILWAVPNCFYPDRSMDGYDRFFRT